VFIAPPPPPPPPPKGVPPGKKVYQSLNPIITTLCNLLDQYQHLCGLPQTYYTGFHTEKEIATECLCIIHNNITTIYCQLSLKFKFESPLSIHNTPSTYLITLLSSHHTRLWSQLTILHKEEIRLLTYQTILVLENILNFWRHPSSVLPYSQPKSHCCPSLITQIVYQPKEILNHYLLSLQSNYYFPLDCEPITMSDIPETTADAQMLPILEGNIISSKGSIGEIGMNSLATTAPITVEHSLDIISDIILDIEANSPPSQTQEEPIFETAQQPIQKHRFSLYKKNSGPIRNTPQAQLILFQSFFTFLPYDVLTTPP